MHLAEPIQIENLPIDHKAPPRFERQEDFDRLLNACLGKGISDIFISPEQPILVQKNKRLFSVTDRVTTAGEMQNLLDWTSNRPNALNVIISGQSIAHRYEIFDSTKVDEYGIRIRHGFRVQICPIEGDGRTVAQIVLRLIPTIPPHFSELGISKSLIDKCLPIDGMVIIAGPTASGKTSTLASIIRFILENDTPIKGNIVTHEDPIEFTFDKVKSPHSIIVSSEIGTHFKTFKEANRAVLRRAPSMVFIGEIRDYDSLHSALQIALSGHPVFCSVHASDVSVVVNRLMSMYPEGESNLGTYDLLQCLRMVIAQKLIIGTNGNLIAVREHLEFTPNIRNTLCESIPKDQICSHIRKLVEDNGDSFSDNATRLHQQGLIDSRYVRLIQGQAYV